MKNDSFIDYYAGLQKDEKSDSFVEKLAMQIVKNLQVSLMRNPHVAISSSCLLDSTLEKHQIPFKWKKKKIKKGLFRMIAILMSFWLKDG